MKPSRGLFLYRKFRSNNERCFYSGAEPSILRCTYVARARRSSLQPRYKYCCKIFKDTRPQRRLHYVRTFCEKGSQKKYAHLDKSFEVVTGFQRRLAPGERSTAAVQHMIRDLHCKQCSLLLVSTTCVLSQQDTRDCTATYTSV